MVETIKELSSLSKKLNKQSNKLNPIISSINESLEKLNLGIEEWLTNPILEPDWQDLDDNDNRVDLWCDTTLLGYARCEGKWQLVIQDATLVKKHNNYGTEYFDVKNSHSLTPLLKASREVRLQAMALIPDLLDLLKVKGEELLKEVEKAEKAAESLQGDD